MNPSKMRLDDFEAYFRSGNDVPVTRVRIPWPGVGETVINLSRCDVQEEVEWPVYDEAKGG